MKKWLSISLIVTMLTAILVGCGGSGTASSYKDTDEEVTLTIAIPWHEQKDTDEVVAEVNKKLETLLPNTKIELLLDSNMADKWPLWMSTKKSIDIAHSGYCTDLENEVNKETYLELNGLVKDYAPNIQKLQEKYWNAYDGATIEGELYAIPNVQIYVKNTIILTVWADAVPYTDLQALKDEAWSSDKTTEKFWSILVEGLDKAKAAGVDCSGCVNLTLYNIAKRGYTFVGGDDSNMCYENSGDGTIIDFYATEEFSTFCTYMKRMADSGYVSKDVLTGQWSDKVYGTNGDVYQYDWATGLPKTYAQGDNAYIALDNPENTVLTTNIGNQATYWSIPFSAKNPARAMKFLDLLHSEEGAEIANLLAYGIEGKHYEVVDKTYGNIKAFEYEGQGGANTSYGIPNWLVSNMLQGMYQVAPYTHERKEAAASYYESLSEAKKHVLYGISFNLDKIDSKMSTLLKNNAEFAESIYSGVVGNSDSMLKELQEKNKVAGQEEIMKELQKQVDEYVSSQK